MPDIKVPVEDLELAWHRFKSHWPHQETQSWTDFLGHMVTCTSDRYGYWATEEGYRKIMLLAGPHWKTMLRVWSIQYRDKLNDKWGN